MARGIRVRPWLVILGALLALIVGVGLVWVGTSSTSESALAGGAGPSSTRATGTALVVTGRDSRPVLRVNGLGALHVACVGGAPSATWRSARRSATQVVGVAGEGATTLVRALQPGQSVRPSLGARSLTTWQIGLLSKREAIVATISLTLGRQDDRTCLAATQVLVTAADHGRYTLIP